MEHASKITMEDQTALIERIYKELGALKEEVGSLRLENAELRKENAALKKENAALKRENAELKREIVKLKKEITELKLKKDSHNSSMRPSSDIVKPKPKPLPNGKKRKQGGQQGTSEIYTSRRIKRLSMKLLSIKSTVTESVLAVASFMIQTVHTKFGNK